MPKPALALAAIAAIAALAACDRSIETAPPASRAPAIEALGPAVDCVQINRIERTVVHDDFTIDFHMAGDTVYRNTLPGRCPSLGFEERFAYRTTTGRLCDVDVITVLYFDGSRGAGCALGEFLPVRINKD